MEAGPSTRKRRISDTSPDTESDSDTTLTGSALQGDHLSFKPLHLVSTWVEPLTTTKRLSLAIVLPSGIGPGQLSVRVAEGGQWVELTVAWPDQLVKPEVMHKKWLDPTSTERFESCHPKCIGFENALKKLRARSLDQFESAARIPLPFPAQSHIHGKHNLAWRSNGVRMLHVGLKAFVEDCAAVSDSESFEFI